MPTPADTYDAIMIEVVPGLKEFIAVIAQIDPYKLIQEGSFKLSQFFQGETKPVEVKTDGKVEAKSETKPETKPLADKLSFAYKLLQGGEELAETQLKLDQFIVRIKQAHSTEDNVKKKQVLADIVSFIRYMMSEFNLKKGQQEQTALSSVSSFFSGAKFLAKQLAPSAWVDNGEPIKRAEEILAKHAAIIEELGARETVTEDAVSDDAVASHGIGF